MATQVKRRRGTTAENDVFTGAEAELTIDTTSKGIRIHDGVKQGGFKVAVSYTPPEPGTYPKVTVDSQGLVTQGSALEASDMPSGISMSKIDGLSAALEDKQDKLNAGQNITITGNSISAVDTTYEAGEGIRIQDNVISTTDYRPVWGSIQGELSEQLDLETALQEKADVSYVHDGKLTIKKNGTVVAEFTANQIEDVEANILADTVATDNVTISKNASDQLQAIGVLEKNTNSVKYDWIGTEAQYEAQNIETLHPEWVCFVTDDDDPLLWGSLSGDITNQTDLVNYINTHGGKIDKIKVNDVEQTITNKTVNISVPTKTSNLTNDSDFQTSTQVSSAITGSIIDDVTHTDTDKSLSANMGKELNDRIDSIKARGRFLSTWNCTTGLAGTTPTTLPYLYNTGDYFIVSVVGESNNLKPNGDRYTGAASETAETGSVSVNDTYLYDGTNWTLLHGADREVTFSAIAGQPTDNTNLAAALNAKQNTIDSSNKLSSDLVDDTDHTNKFVTESEKTTWSGKQDALSEGTGIDIANNIVSVNDNVLRNIGTGTGSLIEHKANATSTSYSTAYGSTATVSSNYCTAIGYHAQALSSQGTAVGWNSKAESTYSTCLGVGAEISSSASATAIGYNAKVTNATNAIQLGNGTNTSAGSLQFRTWEIVDNTGHIPEGRLPYANNAGDAGILAINPDGSILYFNDDDQLDANVSNATVTIRENGTTKGTFTLNQAENATINLTGGTPLGIVTYDGGSANSVYLSNQIIDGGSANSVYVTSQNISGGNANGQ